MTNYMQIKQQTDKEKLKMYLKCSKKKLAKMLIAANKSNETKIIYGTGHPYQPPYYITYDGTETTSYLDTLITAGSTHTTILRDSDNISYKSN